MSRCPFAKPNDAPAGLLTEDALREPYAIYKRFRKEQPVAYIPEQNFWLVTRYDDCEYVLAHPDKFFHARRYRVRMPTGVRRRRSRFSAGRKDTHAPRH